MPLLLLGLEAVLLVRSVHLLWEAVLSSQGLEEIGVIAGLGLPLQPKSLPRGMSGGLCSQRREVTMLTHR